MAYEEVGLNGATISGYLSIFSGKKKIVGIENFSGFGIVNDVGQVRGVGGGRFKGYSGPGFKSVSDGTLTIWHSTWLELVRQYTNEELLTDQEFDVIIKIELVGQPVVTHTLSNCRILTAPYELNTQSVDNFQVAVGIRALNIVTKVG